MATNTATLKERAHVPGPYYVFELPVRIWHWMHALSISTLIVTGYLIASPLPSLTGEASEHFIMGYIRLIHFIAAMVFSVGLVLRIYWAFFGNYHSRELFIIPVWRKEFWTGMLHELKWYGFMTRESSKFLGHNPLAQIAMFVTNILGGIFMICTGFALFSQGTGDGSWADRMFGWVFLIEPSSQTVRMWHLFGMWIMVTFIVIHVYMAIREDLFSRQNGVGAMISGFRRFRDDGPMGPQ